MHVTIYTCFLFTVLESDKIKKKKKKKKKKWLILTVGI